jgi:hypothetical protein
VQTSQQLLLARFSCWRNDFVDVRAVASCAREDLATL